MPNSHVKGAAGERQFCQAVKNFTNGTVCLHRNLDQPRDAGYDLVGHEFFAFEIKRRKMVTDHMIKKWWQQAVDQAVGKNKQPVLAWRQDKQQWRVMIHPECSFDIYDPRGCITVPVELFCKFLIFPNLLNVGLHVHAH